MAVFVQSWLKPGGRLLISDYCCKDGELSEEYKAYVKQRGYFVVSPQQYGQVSTHYSESGNHIGAFHGTHEVAQRRIRN